ncbi:Ger(x)C family spore germination protein [Alkalihalobacillus sp. 1P02AB]|uniref:Ger(x)C family spore germination protein n=1 Tax=Alkalihalobacillus sp. 1P02AB TaxID=3132260 RepID=UPI0039A72A63
MKNCHKMIIWIVVLLQLTACWDQQLLKDKILIKAVGFDNTEDGNIKLTISTLISDSQTILEESFSEIGRTPRESRTKIERALHGNIDPSKNRIVLIQEELAKGDIYPLLDVFYRAPSSSLVAKFAISEGETEKIMKHDKIGTVETGDFLSDLIINSEDNTIIPSINLQKICPFLFDPGFDFIAPLIKLNDTKIEIIGTALFNDKKMTGKMSVEETMLFLLLSNELAKETSLTIPIENDGINIPNNITVNVEEAKSKMEVDDKNPSVRFDLSLKVGVVEFPEDELHNSEKVAELNQIMSEYLTNLASQVIEKLQDANCDGFGIGRHMYGFHHQKWKETGNWKELYPNLTIQPHVNVSIINSGIIN